MRIKYYLLPALPLFTFVFLVFSSYSDTQRLTGSRDAYLSFAMLQLLAFILPAIFYCKAKGDQYVFELKLRVFGLEKAVFLIFSVMVMICLVTAVELLLRKFGISDGLYAHSVYTIYGRTLPELGGNVFDTLYTLVVFAVLPALTEEFLFRSVLYTEYEHLGAPAAIFLTAVIYSFLDMSAVAFIPSFAGGLLLSIIVILAFHFYVPHAGVWWYILSAVVLSFGSFYGDLTESAIKRLCAIKDSGSFVPGLGGAFDVLDSFIYNGLLFWLLYTFKDVL